MHLFAYGTLTFAEVWQRIGLGEFASRAATLREYAVYRIRDTALPGLIHAIDGSTVQGLVYFDLDDETLFELDTYESDLYERVEVMATLDDGSTVPCQTYVIPDSHRRALTDERWDITWFQKNELENYLQG